MISSSEALASTTVIAGDTVDIEKINPSALYRRLFKTFVDLIEKQFSAKDALFIFFD